VFLIEVFYSQVTINLWKGRREPGASGLREARLLSWNSSSQLKSWGFSLQRFLRQCRTPRLAVFINKDVCAEESHVGGVQCVMADRGALVALGRYSLCEESSKVQKGPSWHTRRVRKNVLGGCKLYACFWCFQMSTTRSLSWLGFLLKHWIMNHILCV